MFLCICWLPLYVVPVARTRWRHSLISIMYAELIPLTSTNENARLSSPARKRIPSFQAFFLTALLHTRRHTHSGITASNPGSFPLDLTLFWGFFARDLSSTLWLWRFQSGASKWYVVCSLTCQKEWLYTEFMIITVAGIVNKAALVRKESKTTTRYNVTQPENSGTCEVTQFHATY